MPRRRTLWPWLLAALLAGGAWRWMTGHRFGPDEEEARRILTTHFWVDHLPTSPQETFHLFAPFRFRGHQLGVVQRRTAWEGCWEIFEWRFKEGDERFHVRFPQTGEMLALEWKVEPARERGFDYRLTLRGFKGYPSQWYTRKRWRTGSPEELEERIRAFVPSPR